MSEFYVQTHFDADGDNSAQAIKAADGYLHSLHVVNTNTVDAYVQLFDVATGDVTVGATTPKQTYLVPAGNGSEAGAFDRELGNAPIQFKTAITYACTTTATGSGDPAVGLTVNATYR